MVSRRTLMRGLTQQFGSEYRKSNFCGMKKFKLAVYGAIAVYNYRRKVTLDIFKNFNNIPGSYTNQMCQNMNIKRKYSSGYKHMDTTKKCRKIVIRKGRALSLLLIEAVP